VTSAAAPIPGSERADSELSSTRLDFMVQDQGHVIACLPAPHRTASQVTNRRVESGDRRIDESGDRRIDESGDRRAGIAGPQA
jgi:hypothetical protein